MIKKNDLAMNKAMASSTFIGKAFGGFTQEKRAQNLDVKPCSNWVHSDETFYQGNNETQCLAEKDI